MGYGLKLVTAAQSECITIDEVKAQCNLSPHLHEDDNIIKLYIQAIINAFEEVTDIQLNKATWIQTHDSFPDCDIIYLRKRPLVSVTSIQYIDNDDATQTWNSSKYHVDTYSHQGRVIALETYPSLSTNLFPNVLITYVAGADVIPPALRLGLIEQAAQCYMIREPILTGTIVAPVPNSFLEWARQNYKTYYFGDWNS